ncbi:EKC/KEOPS complex subunit BUD32 [Kwoniella bestiolae CBS 10118]|uniref:EKC/KEOPS complex subunit BUD32 n=1 Tax=Kwoniella bestiolae CBS 10118 TaxID=1296100 RepID=A0A1B9G930_9TREE|nr:BUD32 protein kinase [Kwoniella bestiolae CBS 10118]OCF27554.1 BUD32 protein kinase [Kwoniella bestiolae CBS 10118]
MSSSSSTPYSPSAYYLERGELIKQGAEAKVYSLPSLFPPPKIYYPSSPSSSSSTSTPNRDGVIIKHRFPKKYRHPTLDTSLTSSRLIFEARSLARAAKYGVVVPRVLWVDDRGGCIGLERVEGWSVREVLGGGAEGEMELQEEEEEEVELYMPSSQTGEGERDVQGEGEVEEGNEGWERLKGLGVGRDHLMRSIGSALAKLHLTTIIHGDLTTSNMMIRLTPDSKTQPYEIVLIDFGLSSTAQFPENYAVDLYVLERAFASTHPRSEKLYAGVLEAYARGLGEKKWKPIEIKLKEVRKRGRKRDMTG